MRVAVVGAGWSGCAAAVQATEQGHEVHLLESARQAGGRARGLLIEHRGQSLQLDNGQHILIGAYSHCLALMQMLGVDPKTHLLRSPLAVTFADGQGLALPAWPTWAPPTLAVALGVLRARGWNLHDKLSLLRCAGRWQAMNFACGDQDSVLDLCTDLPERVIDDLIAPLCVSALNTPAGMASGQVFLRVMKDALFASAGGADLLLPTCDLGRLLPEAAVHWLRQKRQTVRLGARVQALQAQGPRWQLTIGQGQNTENQVFDAVLLACPAAEAVRLVSPLPRADAWRQSAQALQHQAIATVYAWAPGARLARPMVALREGPQAPAQFAFDRSQLGGPEGLLAFVVSASTEERAGLQAGVQAQARAQLGIAHLDVVQTVIERRATFACTPGLDRPGQQILPNHHNLLACADYVRGPYPATLEGAVRHGQAAAQTLQ